MVFEEIRGKEGREKALRQQNAPGGNRGRTVVTWPDGEGESPPVTVYILHDVWENIK